MFGKLKAQTSCRYSHSFWKSDLVTKRWTYNLERSDTWSKRSCSSAPEHHRRMLPELFLPGFERPNWMLEDHYPEHTIGKTLSTGSGCVFLSRALWSFPEQGVYLPVTLCELVSYQWGRGFLFWAALRFKTAWAQARLWSLSSRSNQVCK